MTIPAALLVSELNGRECRCGHPKKARQTFCRDCYYRLPRAMRQALYDLVGNGYEEAYEQAAGFLASGGGL